MSDQSHLKNTLPEIPVSIPKDCPLKSDLHRPRMDVDQCVLTINCLIRNDGPRDLKLSSTTGLKGHRGEEWVEASAEWEMGHYRWAFLVKGGMAVNCFMAVTPKGSEYSILHDGGSPFDHISIDDRIALTHLLITSVRKEKGIEVVPCWIVTINGNRPYSAHLHYSLEEAEKARDEQEAHYIKYNEPPEVVKDSQLTEKTIMKEQKSIAFKATSKGLTKTKK